MEAANIYTTFKTWSEKLGNLYEVKLFGQNLIIISDPGIAQEILAKKAKTVSDRPALALVAGSKDSGKYLPFLGNNGMIKLRLHENFTYAWCRTPHEATSIRGYDQ